MVLIEELGFCHCFLAGGEVVGASPSLSSVTSVALGFGFCHDGLLRTGDWLGVFLFLTHGALLSLDSAC